MSKDHDHRVSLLALSCGEASRLISAQQDRALTRRECWALRIHTWLCGACRRFRRHLDCLRELVALMPAPFRTESITGMVQLSPARRDQIKRLLAKAAASE
jgi:hypothetical protein